MLSQQELINHYIEYHVNITQMREISKTRYLTIRDFNILIIYLARDFSPLVERIS